MLDLPKDANWRSRIPVGSTRELYASKANNTGDNNSGDVTMKARQIVLAIFAAMLTASLLIPNIAHAQAVYGSIYGSVTDNTGAVVPNATITITDTAKGTSTTTTSNQSGDFTAEHLIPDVYSVS